MDNINGHRRMNFYHKKSSRIVRSSSMERPGKFSSSMASAELLEGDYKLTDDILYENKMKYKFEDDSHDTVLLNKHSPDINIENYANCSQNLVRALEKSKNYFSQRVDVDRQIINNKKNMYKNQKKFMNEIQFLADEYKKEKIKYKELIDKVNQKKLRENIYQNYTNNSDVSPEGLKKNKEYISYLENSIGKLEKENNELIIMLNSRKQETESQNNGNNYEEEQYYKYFIKNEIDRLKELLVNFKSNTHNQFYLFNDMENNCSKENQNNEKSDKNIDFYEENNMKSIGDYQVYEKTGKNNNSNNNTNNNQNMNQINNRLKKNEMKFNNNNINRNKIVNNERNINEFIINSIAHSGMNNNQKIKNKLKYSNVNNNNNIKNNKSQRAGSKKKK